MHSPRRRLASFAAILCLVATASAADDVDNRQHAHVHGVARIGIAVDHDLLTIQFESPLDSVIGFEHRPNTPAERAAVEALQARMKDPADLFRMTPAAGCMLRKATAESALFEAPPAEGVGEAHADLDTSFEYRCAHVDALASIDVGLFDAYPRLQRIDVEAATGSGQFKRDLRRPARTIALGRR